MFIFNIIYIKSYNLLSISIKGSWSLRVIHSYFFGPPLYSFVALSNKLLVEETIEKMDLRPRDGRKERERERETERERDRETEREGGREGDGVHK